MTHDEPTITVEEGEYRTQKCTCCPNITARVEGYVEENGEDVCYYMVVWISQDASVLNIVLSLFPADPEEDNMRFVCGGAICGTDAAGSASGLSGPQTSRWTRAPWPF